MKNRLESIRSGLRTAAALGQYGANPIRSLNYSPSVVNGKDHALKYNLSAEVLPVPPQDLWLGYGSTESQYIESGKQDVDKMTSILEDTGSSLEEMTLPILDLGCGGGRMLRHLQPYAKQAEIWGLDISAPHINWLKTNLSPPFHFAVNTTIPHLPFSDSYFGLIYCGSLFTHIDDLAESWFMEARRILAKDGILFCTLHDEDTLEVLSKKNPYPITQSISDTLLAVEHTERPDIYVTGQGSDCNVFYKRRYLENILSSFFEIEKTVSSAYGYQTAWVLSKK